MKGINKERLNALISAQEEINEIYNFLEDIQNNTIDDNIKERIEKFLSNKFKVNQKLLSE